MWLIREMPCFRATKRGDQRGLTKVISAFQSSDSGGFRARRRSPQAVAMATLSLRISIPEKNATKMMQFDPSTSVYDACRIIREKLAEASNMGQRKLLLAPKIFSNVLLTNAQIYILLTAVVSPRITYYCYIQYTHSPQTNACLPN